MLIIPVTREKEMRRIAVLGQSKQKLKEISHSTKAWHSGTYCNLSYMGGLSKKMAVEAGP
jgi:hypothetical protein